MVLTCHLVGAAVVEQRVLLECNRSCHLCHARTAWIAERKRSREQHGHVGATRHSGRPKEDAQEDAQELHGRTQRPCACVLVLSRRGKLLQGDSRTSPCSLANVVMTLVCRSTQI